MNEFPMQIQLPNPDRQSRLITFFKSLLSIPWLIWQMLWGIAFEILLVLAWFILLFTGKWPKEFYSFATSYFRYATRLTAWTMNFTHEWPAWNGRPDDEYGLILNLEMKERYNRWKTGFRIVLMFPLMVLSFGVTYYAMIFWFLGFWAIIFTGKLPNWCRRPMADAFSMTQRINAYTYLLVEEWPPLRGEDQVIKDSGSDLPPAPGAIAP